MQEFLTKVVLLDTLIWLSTFNVRQSIHIAVIISNKLSGGVGKTSSLPTK